MSTRNFYTATDIELLNGKGITKLDVGENDTVTAIAVEAAEKLGVTINRAKSSGGRAGLMYSSQVNTTAGPTRQRIIAEASKVLAENSVGTSLPQIATPSRAAQIITAPVVNRTDSSALPDDWMMKYHTFLDTADVSQIRDAVSTGLIDGIATNPNKVAQSGKSYRQVIEEIRKFFNGPIAVQAIGKTTQEICECARRLHAIDPLLAIKITANKEGLAAVKILVKEGVRTNATLMFNPTQALLAGLAGSPFISPFIGRANMVGQEGIDAIRKMRQLLDAFGLNRTNLIAASIKDVDQVIESILAGAHSVAITFPIFEAMCAHPLTTEGLNGFIEEYKTIPQS
jgi:transaldolase